MSWKMQGIKNKFHGFSENFFVDIWWNTQEKKKKSSCWSPSFWLIFQPENHKLFLGILRKLPNFKEKFTEFAGKFDGICRKRTRKFLLGSWQLSFQFPFTILNLKRITIHNSHSGVNFQNSIFNSVFVFFYVKEQE